MAHLREMLPQSPHSPTAKIARLLGNTEEQAREFCEEVQRLIGPNPPSFRTILGCLGRNHQADADRIAAALMIERADVRESQERPKKHTLVRRPTSGGRPNPGSGIDQAGSGDLWLDSVLTPSPISRHDPRKFERGLKKCEHGVLTTQVCAICDPDKFAKMNGSD